MHKPIHNVTQVNLGTAERVEMVIRFDEASGVPLSINNLYMICFDTNANKTVMKFKFAIQNNIHLNNLETFRLDTIYQSIKMPFTNLSLIPS